MEIKCPVCRGQRFSVMGWYGYAVQPHINAATKVSRDSTQLVCVNCGHTQGYTNFNFNSIVTTAISQTTQGTEN